jgi:hypothetical protein
MDVVRKTGMVAGLLSGVVYTLRAGPGLAWYDSGELTSAAFQLGVPHPTGLAPIMMLGKLMTLVPLGEVALRASMLSVLAAALAVGLAAALAARTALEMGASPRWAGAAGALAGLGLACGASMMQNATTIEVTPPSLAVLLGMIALATRGAGRPSGRDVCLVALCFGIGAMTHATVRFHGFLPLVAAVLWSSRSAKRRTFVLAAGATVLGSLVALYLPLSSLRDGPLDWGDPETLARLWDHLSGGRIRRAFEGRMLNPAWTSIDAAHFGRLVLGDLGGSLCFLSATGLLGLYRHRSGQLLGLVALVDAAYCIALNPMGIVDRQVGLPLIALLSILGGVGLVVVARVPFLLFSKRSASVGVTVPSAVVIPRWRPRLWPAVAALCGISTAVFAVTSAVRWTGPGRGPAGLVSGTLAVPPRAVILCSGDNLCGGLLWAQYVEGSRPDVVALPRQHLWDVATLHARLDRHAPDLVRDTPVPPRGLTLAAAVALLGRGRDVYWERGGDEGDLRSARSEARLELDAPVALLHLGGERRSVEVARDELSVAVERWYGRQVPPDDVGRSVVAGLLTSLAISAGEHGDAVTAADLLHRSVELHRSASAYVNLSALEVRADRLEAARRWLDLAVQTEPGSVRALTALGKLHLSQEHDAEAEPCFERARRLCPSRCGAPLEGLGILAARRGDLSGARALLTEALRREPWLEDARVNLELIDRIDPRGILPR